MTPPSSPTLTCTQVSYEPERAFLELLLPDMAPSMPVLLRARAVTTAARLGSQLSAASMAQFITAMLATLQPSEPMVLRFSGCRAIVIASEACDTLTIAAAAPTLLPQLASLLSSPCEEGVLLALDAVGSILRANPAAAAQSEPWLVPTLLQLWSATMHQQRAA